jgi:hypothetical protein
MQSSGPISIGQARNECQLGNPVHYGDGTLSKLAGVSPGQRGAWSYWYGKSNGLTVTETWTQYYTINYTHANNANFGRSEFIYYGGGYWRQSGGDTTVSNPPFPSGTVNGFVIAGFIRHGTNLTVFAGNNSLDGVVFQSSIGDNVRLTNDISYSQQFGPNLWTFYGASGAVNEGAPRTYQINLIGSAQRPQPPSGYINGVAPTPPDPNAYSGGGNGHCFVEGSLVLMADLTWKHIQSVQAGDYVLGPRGPAHVQRLHVIELGSRKLLSFAEDPRHMWSEEHPYWVRQNGKQWWWTANKDMLQDQFRSGLLRGLKDPNSLLDGQAEFATLNGFVNRTPVTMIAADPKQKLYVPVVENSPIIVNGYVVGGFLSEHQFDYSTFDWGVHIPQFEVASAYLTLNKKWIKDYHDYFDRLAIA